jgi:hypothetical protein
MFKILTCSKYSEICLIKSLIMLSLHKYDPMTKSQNNFLLYEFYESDIAYCYNLDNAITFSWSKCDKIKWLPLYFQF